MKFSDPSKEIKDGFLDLVMDLIESYLKIDLRKYSSKAVIIVIILVVICLSAYFFILNKSKTVNNFTQEIKSGTPISGSNMFQISAAEQAKVDVHINTVSESEMVLFQAGKWKQGLGNLASWKNNANRIILPIDEKSALIKYLNPIPKDSKFVIRLKPWSVKTINFVLQINPIYEVVIGDGDYRTVALKKSAGVDQPIQDPVPKVNLDNPTDITDIRPKFEYEVARGREMEILVYQRLLPDGKLWVQLDIQYWTKDGVPDLDVFKFTFTPSPSIVDSLFLNLGLVRLKGSEEISAEFIDPSLD